MTQSPKFAFVALAILAFSSAAEASSISGTLANDTGTAVNDLHFSLDRASVVTGGASPDFDEEAFGGPRIIFHMDVDYGHGGPFIPVGGTVSFTIEFTASAHPRLVTGWWTRDGGKIGGSFDARTLAQLSFDLDGCTPSADLVCSGLLSDPKAAVGIGAAPLPGSAILLLGALAPLMARRRRPAPQIFS